MKLIYHPGTGTVIDASDDTYVIDTADMTEEEYDTFVDGDESVLEEVLDTGRATLLKEVIGE